MDPDPDPLRVADPDLHQNVTDPQHCSKSLSSITGTFLATLRAAFIGRYAAAAWACSAAAAAYSASAARFLSGRRRRGGQQKAQPVPIQRGGGGGLAPQETAAQARGINSNI